MNNTDTLPALILLDISMPLLDGLGFRAEQIKDPRLSKIPTAIVSTDGNVIDKALKADVQELLKKPIELDDLLVLVAKYCG